ncbi:hypothetical protein [Yinghuangia soli]|uniref:Uncharacterized protein n=1 Tax=Yinghuangia soli TaxID=2908204 RepID=A0AA41TZ33_9ACTN|nr:hypothetical protein [Yinghuangia soli]MCF2528418.1 hypothetical protein [Yinghuangia soli]
MERIYGPQPIRACLERALVVVPEQYCRMLVSPQDELSSLFDKENQALAGASARRHVTPERDMLEQSFAT